MSARIVRKHLSDDHYAKLMAHLSANQTDNNLLVELLARTGMRQDELCRITADNIDASECRLFVQASKDSNSRWVPIRKELKPRLKDLSAQLGTMTIGSWYCSTENLESQKRAVRRLVHSVLEQCIGSHNYTTHSLRHTYAIRLLKVTGNDLLKVQLALGHKSINSTARYLQYLRCEDIAEDILTAVG